MVKQLILNGIECPYDIYDDGRIYSYYKEDFMKKILDKRDGYHRVKIFIPGTGPRFMSVHRLIALMFIPNPDNLPQVNHKNGIKTDNNVENLEWVTAKENTNHAIRMNLRHSIPKGVDCPSTKYKIETIERICQLLSEQKYTAKEIGIMTNSNRQLVQAIAHRERWTEISDKYPNIKLVGLDSRNDFARFHDWIDSMIDDGVSMKEMLTRVRNEGLTFREAYNLVYGRVQRLSLRR